MSHAACIATVAACLLAPAAPAVETPEALRKSIASGNQDWIEGIKAHDAGRIAATYDEQAINCSAAGECVKGRAAIEKQMIFHNASLPDR